MRDWRNEVEQVLAAGKFSAAEREEISLELAGYLDDLYHAARNRGLDEAAAIKYAFAELHEDARLGQHLRRAREENTMNDRTKHLWLPGCIILLASALALALLQLAGFSPYFPRAWAGNVGAEPFLHDSLMIYIPWLGVLPFLGAAGAYWSRRTGSRPALRIAVGIFPAIVFLGTFLVFVPVSLAIDTLPAKIFLPAFAGLILSWVVI
ncbi:MAG: hypothetical protein WAL78_15460, partial [Candidatus Acidiferrales bacterium]